MKRVIFILLAAWGVSRAAAQDIDVHFDFDLYPEYYSHYDEDIYRYGFNINNYAMQYEDRFIDEIYRDYGIRRMVTRRYLRRGFSPSDILFGAELAFRTGHRFEYIMEGYYDSSSRDWIRIAFNLGIPFGTPRFDLILGSFNRYYMDWGHYYHHHHPYGPPPMYSNDWSYFRPSPAPNHRPPQVGRPGPTRPGYSGSDRPNSSAQPDRRPGQSSRPTRPSDDSGSGYRPGSSNGSSTSPSRNGGSSDSASPSRGSSSSGYRPGSSNGSSTSPSRNGGSSDSASPSRGSSGSSDRRSSASPSRSNESSPSASPSRSSSSGSDRGSSVSPSRSSSSSGGASSRGSSSSSSRSSSPSRSGGSSSGRR